MEVNSRSSLRKIEKWLIKVLPFVLAFISFLNTFLSYFYIDLPILSYLGGVSLLPLLFMYLCSFAYQFCFYNRLPIYYIAINWILNIIDYYIELPLTNRALFSLYIIITFVFITLLIYGHCKKRNVKVFKRNR